MNSLYSLYDALVGIDVPGDKALAVVDAMEREMATNLATKMDLERFATKADWERFATKADLERFATKADLERFATKADLAKAIETCATKADLERFATKADLAKALEGVATKDELKTEIQLAMSQQTVRLGTMLYGGLGFTLAVITILVTYFR